MSGSDDLFRARFVGETGWGSFAVSFDFKGEQKTETHRSRTELVYSLPRMSRRLFSNQRLVRFVLVGVLSQLSLLAQDRAQIEHQLRAEYLHKNRLLRGFCNGSELKYDHDGTLADPCPVQAWTLSFVEINSLSLGTDRINIEGVRTASRFDPQGRQHFSYREIPDPSTGRRPYQKEHVSLVISRDPDNSLDQIETSLSNLFVAEHESLLPVVPAFWREYIKDPAADSETRQQADIQAKLRSGKTVYVFKPGKGLTPPKAIETPEPTYSEPARLVRYQGTTRIRLIVDSDGSVHEPQIDRPAGFGLDERAIDTVGRWRFQPATKDGVPVAISIFVEVSFRTY